MSAFRLYVCPCLPAALCASCVNPALAKIASFLYDKYITHPKIEKYFDRAVRERIKKGKEKKGRVLKGKSVKGY